MEGTTTSERATTSWAKRIFAITLFVDDLAEAKEFYGDIFQMPVLNDDDTSIAFGFPGMVVNLLSVAAAPELIEPAIVGHRGTPSRMMLTLEVDDVDAVCQRLRAQGVEFLNGPLDRPWGPRTATFADPGGHCWELSS
jgi:lactoylglutathione lyase